ncbi:type II secretion system protein E [Clostridium sp. CAG:1193]|nr:type II secretion system protein E [Clostridium sp. CAG:1193]
MIKTFDYEKLPIVEVVNEILYDASKRGASDIHFDPEEDEMKVRIRIDGLLSDYTTIPNTLKKNLITRIKIMSGMNITEVRLPQDGAIKTTIKEENLDLRVSSLPTNEGEKIVIRILDYSMSLKGIEYLGFSERNFKKISKLINIPSGIILVTGATGSGKSTTVYSILQKLNRTETNLITVEDPIEMNIKGINQVQVNSEIGLTFANVLRSVLRQDPDIVMIGEIRDNETAKIAVRASITGHLVLSTIHTNNSLNTIERLLDMEVERYLLASALEGIISQKLARKLCDKCKKKRPTNSYEKEIFRKVFGMEINEIYSAVGCPECGSGYRGRIAIHEVLLITQEIRDAISNNMPKDELRNLVYNTDVNTLLQDGLEKVINGYTTFEEIIKLIELDDVADDKNASSAYKYDLHNAIEQTELSKTSQLNVNDVKNSAKIYSPVTEKSLFKSDTPSVSNEPVNNVQTIIKPPSLDDTQVLDL